MKDTERWHRSLPRQLCLLRGHVLARAACILFFGLLVITAPRSGRAEPSPQAPGSARPAESAAAPATPTPSAEPASAAQAEDRRVPLATCDNCRDERVSSA